jgi:acetylglutamate synthase
VLIVYFVNNKFSLISKISDILTDEINQLKYIDNSLFLACPSKSQIVRVDFPKLAVDNRRKSVLGGFDVEFIHSLSTHSIEKHTLKSNTSIISERATWMGRATNGLNLMFKMDGYLNVCLKSRKGFDFTKDLNDSCTSESLRYIVCRP